MSDRKVFTHSWCCHCYSFLLLWWLPWDDSWSHFCSLLLSQQLPVVFCCSLIFAHLTVFLSFPVGQLPPIVTWCVCAGGVSTVLCGRSSSITLASCLAWIGIWFHFSLISGPPSSAHLVLSYHANSCWMHISKCASNYYHDYSHLWTIPEHIRHIGLVQYNFDVIFKRQKGNICFTCTVHSLSILTVTNLLLFLHCTPENWIWNALQYTMLLTQYECSQVKEKIESFNLRVIISFQIQQTTKWKKASICWMSTYSVSYPFASFYICGQWVEQCPIHKSPVALVFVLSSCISFIPFSLSLEWWDNRVSAIFPTLLWFHRISLDVCCHQQLSPTSILYCFTEENTMQYKLLTCFSTSVLKQVPCWVYFAVFGFSHIA